MAKEKEAPKSSAKKPARPAIQVRAKRLGFYGHMLRPVGTVFMFRPTEHEDCPAWCEKVDGEAKPDDEPQESTSEESKGSSSDEVI